MLKCLKCRKKVLPTRQEYCCTCGHIYCYNHFMVSCDKDKCENIVCCTCLKLFGCQESYFNYCPACT